MDIILGFLFLCAVYCLRAIYVLTCHIKAINDISLNDPKLYEKLSIINNSDEKIHALKLTKWTTKQFFPELYDD